MNIQDIASASAMIKQELEPLAQKIGQGVEYTFGLFIRQVYANAFVQLFWFPLIGLLVWLSTKLWKYHTDDRYSDFPDSLAKFLSVVCILLSIGIFGAVGTDIVNALINPEYQAIRLIITTFKEAK